MAVKNNTSNAKNNYDNLIFLKFEDSKLPAFKELRNKQWIYFGEKDDYPDYLLLLVNKSAKHNAIINGKVNYIFGNGLKSNSESPKLTDWVAKLNSSNESGDDIAIKAIKDCEVFGGFYWQVIPNLMGELEIYHVDFSKIRTNQDRSEFYYKKDWSDPKEQLKTFPKYVKGIKCASIFSFREYRQGLGVYPLPNYISAINYIESDYEVSKNTLSNAKTGFSASKFINFFNGEPEDETKKRSIEKRFNDKFTGSEGKKIIIGFNNDPSKKPTIDDLGASDLTKEDFTAVDNLITSNIYAGHQITSPMLFGIQEPGKLGQSNELKFSYDIFKNTYVNFKQKQIEAIFNYFGEIITGEKSDLKLIDVDPIGIPFTDQTIVQVAPVEWIWEKLGIDPSKYPNATPAIQPSKPGAAAGAPPPASENMINENIKNLSAKQHQQLMRIIRQFSKGQLTKEQASTLLKTSLGLNDGDINQLLGVEEDAAFSAQYSEEDVANMFDTIGEARQNFSVIKTRKAKFSENEFEQSEIFASVKNATDQESEILALIKSNKKITNQEIADALSLDLPIVEQTIAAIEKKGLLKTVGSVRSIIGGKDTKSNLPEIFIKYSYDTRPGAGPDIISGTRPFCRKLVQLDRLYSRAEIQQISMRVGYSVFEREGGFWNKNGTILPHCRHIWNSHIVIKNKNNE